MFVGLAAMFCWFGVTSFAPRTMFCASDGGLESCSTEPLTTEEKLRGVGLLVVSAGFLAKAAFYAWRLRRDPRASTDG